MDTSHNTGRNFDGHITPNSTSGRSAHTPVSMTNVEQDIHDYGNCDGWLTQTEHLSKIIFWTIHTSSLLVIAVGAPLDAVLLGVVTYAIRIFGITGSFHRYFAHRSFKTSRGFQFLLGLLGTMGVQKGPLWWAGTHRRHHLYSDQPGDPHSPTDGIWHSHCGWIFEGRWGGTPGDQIRDFTKFPELVYLNRWHFLPPLVLALICYAIAGWPGVVWGFSVSTTLLWHSTFSVNSVTHLWGPRRYATDDTSRNNWVVALFTFGEGWHNNHHHYMSSARMGFKWWEIDVTYYILRLLAAFGIIWDLRVPTESIRNRNLVRMRKTDVPI